MGVLIALLIGGLVSANGALFLFNPRLWMSIANRVTRFAWGERPGFRFSPERLTAADMLQYRICGGIMTLLGATILVRVVSATTMWLSAKEPAPSAAHRISDGTGGVTAAGRIFLGLWVICGALLVVKPRWTLRFFGSVRNLDVSDRFLWVFRVIGAGLAISGMYAILR
jgi:hypothetical protein